MRAIFALGRILGNELPPRDRPGGRLDSLVQLLREPELPGAIRFWVINRIWDSALAAAYRELLVRDARLGRVHEIPFEPDRYFEADGRDDRLCYCPGVNHARNETLRIAFERYGAYYAGVFDGDCGFTDSQWREVSSAIVGDRRDGVGRSAYSVPSLRMDCGLWDALMDGHPTIAIGRPQEPMLFVGRKGWEGGIRFDESRPFGANDKVDLLLRLGHHPGHGRQHELVREDLCRSVGSCCHINTGDDDVERDDGRRTAARREALEQLHADITRRHGGGA